MRITVCDSCGKRVKSWRQDYLGPNYEMIVVEANEDADHGQFCSWVCLAAWATDKAMKAETPTEWEPPESGDDPHLSDRARFGA